VSEPLALLKRVSSYVKPNGYLYVEVPQDLRDDQISDLKRGPAPSGVPIHEHINGYCRSSVACLARAAGLQPIDIETTKVDLGWTTGTNIRALCKKQS